MGPAAGVFHAPCPPSLRTAVGEACRRGAVEVPREGEAAVLILLEPLEFLDEVELEFDGNPGGEFEGDVLVGVCAAVAAGFGNQADGIGDLNPPLRRQNKAVQSRLLSNPIEFDGIKPGVVQPLPNTEELNSIPIPQ